MAAMPVCEEDAKLASQCLDFCQTLAGKSLTFSFSLTIGSSFSFSVDTMEKEVLVPQRKKKTPSTLRRDARRREELLKKKLKTSTVNPPSEQASVQEAEVPSPAETAAAEKATADKVAAGKTTAGEAVVKEAGVENDSEVERTCPKCKEKFCEKTCARCKNTFLDNYQFEKHMAQKHRIFQCKKCDAKFQSSKARLVHCVEVHECVKHMHQYYCFFYEHPGESGSN